MLDPIPSRAPAPVSLPSDLERTIFEIAAHSRPLSIRTLILVAWRVKIWVEPLLYRTIVWGHIRLNTYCLYASGRNNILKIIESKPSSFFQDNVHNLWVGGSGRPRATLLTACRGVKNMWLGTTGETGHDLVSLLQEMPLEHLHCNLRYLFDAPATQIDFTHRLFARITHLEVRDYVPTIDPEIWGNLAHIPHLTHLCFCEPVFVQFLPTLLRRCRSLRVLVVLHNVHFTETDIRAFQMRSPDEGRKLTKDPRFVVMDCQYQAKDWEVGAHTGIDYWSRAGELVAKRLSGEVDALQYRIEVDESLGLK